MALFKRAYLLFLASALALPETSCIFDDLEPCEDANIGFSITNNWGTDTSANPEGMAYLFFTIADASHGVLISPAKRQEESPFRKGATAS